ncbi:prolipoprotein diacylglyceryl transferase [Acidimicrobiales bacterium]|nr:prolipoprotein diacylglyceryl transferase [Acidimicrobiales bacterium]
MLELIASIPSPSSGSLELGPLTLRAYGIMIALGVLAAVWLGQKRWSAVGGGPDDVAHIAMWAVPAGLIGARVYHVLTDWRFDEGWTEPFKLWEGGLGIPGGVIAGVLTATWLMRRNSWQRGSMLDAIIPALPLAQAIGRWGNWFNQELFGGPSGLPWAVEIDARYAAAAGHSDIETFHPTFLYESLWNFGLVFFLIWVDRTQKIKRGGLFAVYVVGYLVARLWLETVRVDHASEIAGVRINIWMSVIGIGLAGGWLLLRGRRGAESDGASVGCEEVKVAVSEDGGA